MSLDTEILSTGFLVLLRLRVLLYGEIKRYKNPIQILKFCRLVFLVLLRLRVLLYGEIKRYKNPIQIKCIHIFLNIDTAVLIAQALVSGRLDYCNSLLYGVSKANVGKLQIFQNALCCIVFRLDRVSHATPYLKKLHCLRILFIFNTSFLKPPISSKLKSSSRGVTRGNRQSLSLVHPRKAHRELWFCQLLNHWNGTGSHSMSDPTDHFKI